MHLGEKIRQLRKEKEWTQPELAQEIGIEQSYLSKLENGKSIPSADIFQLIMAKFDLSIHELLDGVDQSIVHRHLRQIPEVANYLSLSKSNDLRSRRIWLVSSAFCFVIGFVLLIASQFGLLLPESQYQYISEGVVKEGESKEIFTNFMQGYAGFDHDRMTKRQQEMNERLDEVYLLSSSYRGQIFNIPVEGGSRTYRLEGHHTLAREENSYIAFVGSFLLLLGIAGLFLERKLWA